MPYLTFTNPTPANLDYFGSAVAALGSDKIIVGARLDNAGATDAGAAYLFSINGALLTTFTNPTPANSDWFGSQVAAVGTDKLLIGAEQDNTGANFAGAAYLFSTNGTLLTTFTNPTPVSGDFFGLGLASVGTDMVIICSEETTGGNKPGAAYLFNINGGLIATFTNPAPTASSLFGIGLAMSGFDKIIIGSAGSTNPGAAFLFHTNGTLMTTFTNPAPAKLDWFGLSVAAVGLDKVLIGAMGQSNGITQCGLAYIFNTNGALLTTFTNPTPANGDRFGVSVAAVGTDKVLIGADSDSTGATRCGAAYLFSTNGILLITITNPVPTVDARFGSDVAVVNINKALIGAYQNDAGAPDAGAAFLFDLIPSLTISPTTTNMLSISWAAAWTDWTLQQNTNINSGNWIAAEENIADNGTTKSVIVKPSSEKQFYRLFKP